MNKLVFTLKNKWGSDIVFIANNHKDLEDHLKENYDWCEIEIKDDSVVIRMGEEYENEFASLEWVKHI